jgi:hypothetical protein
MPVFFRKLPSDKIIFFALCILALAGNIYLFFFDKAPHSYGRDFNIYASAVRTYCSGGNPYSADELAGRSGDFIPFTSPPITLPVFSVLINFSKPFGYWVLYLLFLALSILVAARSFKDNDLLYLLVLFLSGFWAFYLNMMTGNIELLMLLVFSASYFFYARNRLPAFYLSVGVLAMFKVAPALFGLPALLIGGGKRSKVRAALLFFGILAVFNGLSWALYGRLHLAWLKQLFDQSAIRDAAGWSGVSFFALAYRFLLAEDRDPLFFAGLLHVIFSAVCVLGFIIFKRRVADRSAVFFFGVLATMLTMPRLRDYSFVYALIPVYYLTRRFDFGRKSAVLGMCLIIPALSKTSIVQRLTDASPLFLIFHYAHLISLIFIFCYIYVIYARSDNQLQAEP